MGAVSVLQLLPDGWRFAAGMAGVSLPDGWRFAAGMAGVSLPDAGVSLPDAARWLPALSLLDGCYSHWNRVDSQLERCMVCWRLDASSLGGRTHVVQWLPDADIP